MQPQKPQGAKAAPSTETLRKKVLVDGNTLELARQLGISVEEYVDHVVHFFLHPPEEPILYVVEAQDPQAVEHREPQVQRKAG